MKIKQLCRNCGSEWETDEPTEIWDELRKKWLIVDSEWCTDCLIEVGAL